MSELPQRPDAGAPQPFRRLRKRELILVVGVVIGVLVALVVAGALSNKPKPTSCSAASPELLAVIDAHPPLVSGQVIDSYTRVEATKGDPSSFGDPELKSSERSSRSSTEGVGAHVERAA